MLWQANATSVATLRAPHSFNLPVLFILRPKDAVNANLVFLFLPVLLLQLRHHRRVRQRRPNLRLFCQDSSSRLNCSEEFKVSLSAHSCGAEIVPDNEDRNLVVHGDHYRSWNAGLCVDEMVAARSLKLEPVLLKYSDESLIRNGRDFRHVSALEPAVFFPARQSPAPSSLQPPW